MPDSSAMKVACAIASSFVLGYVIEGEFRFGIDGETQRDLPVGQAFTNHPERCTRLVLVRVRTRPPKFSRSSSLLQTRYIKIVKTA
jgi:hypothetical protein